jgi:protein involved in sex pheromone biosynthesis
MKQKLNIAIIAIASVLSACASAPQKTVDTNDINQLQNIMAEPVKNGVTGFDTSQIRFKSLEDTGMSLGAQAGLAHAAQEIEKIKNIWKPCLTLMA